ncbi:right-handed parallel beta-helix repeat-containing protein [Methanobrevibacter sp.]|uniref:right-handed parallel beta-helix repeat-containing protein n=1 Tax=Methanobrevibacter sp. TaxID=66852 RepID=UPI00387033E8
MISNRLTRRLIVLFAIISILLIVPASFASENNTVEQDPEILTLSETDNVVLEETTQKIDVVYVDASTGTNNGTGNPDNPVGTISEGLSLVNDGGTIYLNGKFSDDGNSNITLNGTPTEITFIGVENAIIDGNNKNTFAIVNKGAYSFENISFINHHKTGNETFGGAFSNSGGTLKFTNCLFENNDILGINKGNGGAIDNAGHLTLNNCTFRNNIANVTNSSGFRKNSADGGAISNTGTLYVYNTNFIENKVLRNGGAIATQDRSHTFIDNCNFTGNIAAYHLSGGSYGGAIYTWDCGLELYNSTFKNNKVYDASGYGAHGGALSLNRASGSMNIFYCQFINNTADGIKTVDGQSIYFESVDATLNYCTIDTSIYSASQSVNLNYNWWAVNNTDIKSLIENLPSSAGVKTFAELKISSDSENIEIGDDVNVYVNLCWNGTENKDKISLIPLRSVNLESVGGALGQTDGKLVNGSFKTTFKPTSKDILIIANVDNVIVTSDLSKMGTPQMSIVAEDIFEGEDATILINLKNNQTGICLIDIGDGKYYAEITNGKGKATIRGLNVGKHEIIAKYNYIQANETLTVKNKLDSKMEVNINENNEVPIINVRLDEDATGTVSVNINGVEIVTKVIGKNGVEIPLEKLSKGVYSLEVIYSGDDYFASKSIFSGLAVGDGRKDVKLEVASSFTQAAVDYKDGERGKYIYATLKDEDGNLLSNKTVQIALNGHVYKVITNKQGKASLQVNLATAGTYYYTMSFAGDNQCNAAPLAVTKLTVTKKSTSIKASAKKFKANKKTKSIQVTLKTVKSKNGKTYLSKGKKLTLKIKGKTYTAKTNAKGVAKFTIKSTKKGKYNALIKFAGDKTYKKSSKKIKITIK